MAMTDVFLAALSALTSIATLGSIVALSVSYSRLHAKGAR
jgi:hypothetical protein